MRIIGGTFRSRKLKTVSGNMVRPTPDRLREALFNVLAGQIEGSVFLDAYAGSGAVGIEALSRGARQVVLIEKNSEALAVIRGNLAELGVKEGVVIARGAAATTLPRHQCDIAFVDPPYTQPSEYELSMNLLAGSTCPLVIAQHESRLALAAAYGSLERTRVLRQGDNSLSFYHKVSR